MQFNLYLKNRTRAEAKKKKSHVNVSNPEKSKVKQYLGGKRGRKIMRL